MYSSIISLEHWNHLCQVSCNPAMQDKLKLVSYNLDAIFKQMPLIALIFINVCYLTIELFMVL